MNRPFDVRVRGLTLVELLATIPLILIVVLAIGVLERTGRQFWVRTDSQMTLLTQSQRALDHLHEDLRQASRSCLACPGSDLWLAQADNGTCKTETRIHYQRANDQLLRIPEGQAAELITPGATAFATTCTNGLVEVSLTLQADARSGATIYRNESKIFVQNP